MPFRILLFSLLLSMTACAAVQIELPAISDSSSGERLAGEFIWHDLISDDPEGSIKFYGELLGWKFEPLAALPGKYWTISFNGASIGGMVAQTTLPTSRDVSQWISAISVADADAARLRVHDAGGEVLRDPVSLGARGTVGVYADPQGAIFATLTTPMGDPIGTGELPAQGEFLWHELWTSDVFAAGPFYAALSDNVEVDELDSRDAGDHIVQYHVLRRNGRPAAGVRDVPDPQMPSLWMPFLRVNSLAQLETLLSTVSDLGGEVLVPAIARPERGHVAVIAGPSGAPIAFQTWKDGEVQVGDL